MKTYYIAMDKKESALNIAADMANGQTVFQTLFNDEFITLTKIGNSFRFRHETDKIEILMKSIMINF